MRNSFNQRAGAAVLVCLFATTTFGQFLSETVDFNSSPIGSAENSQEMFQIPEFSNSTDRYVVPNLPASFNNNSTFRNDLLTAPPAPNPAALETIFTWVDPSDADAWVRLTTNNGPITPNPALSTAGKVRLIVVGNPFGASMGLAIGVRETGRDVPQLADGGTDQAGGEPAAIEWVGVTTDNTTILANSNGIESTLGGDDVFVTTSGLQAINWGPNQILESTLGGDDEFASGFIFARDGGRTPIPALVIPSFPVGRLIEWDLAAGTVRISSDTTPGNFGAPMGGFGDFTGNGTLADSPNGRGTLEHLAITNIATDLTTQTNMSIDNLVFESPVAEPAVAPTIVEPIIDGDPSITVTDLVLGVNEVRVFRNTQAAPETSLFIATNDDLDVTLLSPAATGDVFWAKQVTADSGSSGFSEPVTVVPPGLLLVETFDTYADDAEMKTVWNNSIAGPTDELRLESGNAVSCNNFIEEFNENSTTFFEARAYRGFGSVNGSDATPLNATWRFRHTGTSGNMRTRFELARFPGEGWTAGPRANGTTGFGFTNNLGGVFSSQYVIMLRSATDPDGGGSVFQLDTSTNYYCAATGVSRSADVWHKFDIIIDSDFINYFVDDELIILPGFPDGVPRPDAGPYQFNVLGVGLSTNDGQMQWDDIAVTTGSPVLPFGDPPPLSPQFAGALLPGQTSVSVIDVNTNATRVFVLDDATTIGFANSNGEFETTTLTIPVSPLLEGSLLTVRQVVDGVESCDSQPVPSGGVPDAPNIVTPVEADDPTVTVENIDPSASLVTVFANSNAIGSIDPGGATTVAVPVIPLVALDILEAAASNPIGQGAFSDSVEVGRGNGTFLLSVGVRETGQTEGPVGADGGFSGGIEWVGPSATSNGAPQGIQITPGPTWQPITFDPTSDPILGFAGGSANGTIAGTWGTLEHFAIAVDSSSPNRSVGAYSIYIDNIQSGSDLLTDFESFGTGSTDVLLRSPSFSGSTSSNLNPPPNVSQVAGIGNPGKSLNCQFYFEDTSSNRWVRLTSFNVATLGNPLIRLDQPLTFDLLVLESQPPPAPSLESPLEAGDTTVTVNDILVDALSVDVLADGAVIATEDPAGSTNGFEIDVPPLVHLEEITVRQATIDGASPQSSSIEVGKGNGVITLSLGVRETGDAGPIGSEGSTSGEITWIGASGTASGAPIGIQLSPSNNWQTVTFDPSVNTLGFVAANDTLDTATGTIEHLAVSVAPLSPNRSSGVYRMFIDNVVNADVGGPGVDTLITDFEGFPFDEEVIFQEPTLSGSTDFNLLFPPSASANSDDYNNGGERSQLLTWFFRDTSEGRWTRITTFNTESLASPIVDLTKPIEMDILLLAGCSTAFGDMDGDCDIDADDTTLFNGCLASGPDSSSGTGCTCADFNGNGRVDLFDYQAFQEAAGVEDANGGTIPDCTP